MMKKAYTPPRIEVVEVPELCSNEFDQGSVVNSDTGKTEDNFDVKDDNGENPWGGD